MSVCVCVCVLTSVLIMANDLCIEACKVLVLILFLLLDLDLTRAARGRQCCLSTRLPREACSNSAVLAGGSPERAWRCVCSLWPLAGGSPGLE